MSPGIDSFPRPAFFDDLGALMKQEHEGTVLLLMDSDPETCARVLADWVSIMPGVVVHAARMANRAEPVDLPDAATDHCVRQIRLPHWMGHGLSKKDTEVLLHLQPVPDAVLSVQAYDAHGEFVKTALEGSLATLIGQWHALYLVHDPCNRVLRPQDSGLLKDRLRLRPLRLKFYHGIMLVLFAVGVVGSRITATPGWRCIK